MHLQKLDAHIWKESKKNFAHAFFNIVMEHYKYFRNVHQETWNYTTNGSYNKEPETIEFTSIQNLKTKLNDSYLFNSNFFDPIKEYLYTWILDWSFANYTFFETEILKNNKKLTHSFYTECVETTFEEHAKTPVQELLALALENPENLAEFQKKRLHFIL